MAWGDPRTRRGFLRFSLMGAAATALLAACGGPAAAPTTAPAKPAESKPAETKPAEAKPTAAAAPAAVATVPAVIKPASGAKGITLRFHSRTGSEADTLNERLPEFADKTGIEVKPEQFPGGEYYQKMQTLIAGGQMGDVIWMSSTVGMPIWGATGIIQPIDDFISQEKFDLGQYYKAAVDQLIYQGKTYALPFKLQPGQMGLYYNSNAFKEASVKEPTLTTTFDELIQLSKELHKGSGDRVERFGFLPWIFTADNTGGFQMTAHYARAWGAELMDAEGKKALMTEQKFKDAIIWVNDVIFKHKIAPSAKQVTGDPDQMFVAGMGAMYQSGSWTKSVQTRIKDNKFEVKATLMPKGPGGKRGSMAIADSIGINAKAKNPKEAWELTKFLCDQETGIRLGEGRGGASGTSGGRKDVFESERLKKNPLHPIWIEAVGVAEAPRLPGNFRTVEFATALWQKMNALWIGDEQPTEKFFQELNAACQQVLDQPRP